MPSPPIHREDCMKRQSRAADTYRAARRNAARGLVWPGIKPTGRIYHGPVQLNRSRHLPPKKTYAEAHAYSSSLPGYRHK